MTKEHKWAAAIRAYADNLAIQYRVIDENEFYLGLWIDHTEDGDTDSPNFNDPCLEWRVRPTMIRGRVAVFFDESQKDYFMVLIHESYFDETEKEPNFVKWLTGVLEYGDEGE